MIAGITILQYYQSDYYSPAAHGSDWTIQSKCKLLTPTVSFFLRLFSRMWYTHLFLMRHCCLVNTLSAELKYLDMYCASWQYLCAIWYPTVIYHTSWNTAHDKQLPSQNLCTGAYLIVEAKRKWKSGGFFCKIPFKKYLSHFLCFLLIKLKLFH